MDERFVAVMEGDDPKETLSIDLHQSHRLQSLSSIVRTTSLRLRFHGDGHGVSGLEQIRILIWYRSSLTRHLLRLLPRPPIYLLIEFEHNNQVTPVDYDPVEHERAVRLLLEVCEGLHMRFDLEYREVNKSG
jgi:hypothetical protein